MKVKKVDGQEVFTKLQNDPDFRRQFLREYMQYDSRHMAKMYESTPKTIVGYASKARRFEMKAPIPSAPEFEPESQICVDVNGNVSGLVYFQIADLESLFEYVRTVAQQRNLAQVSLVTLERRANEFESAKNSAIKKLAAADEEIGRLKDLLREQPQDGKGYLERIASVIKGKDHIVTIDDES